MKADVFRTEAAWKAQLILTPTHKPTGCLSNAIAFLDNSPEWAAVVARDEFADAVKIMRPTPWQRGMNGSWTPKLWGDTDDILVAQWLQQAGVPCSVMTAAQAVTAVADRSKFHPIRDYLNGLQWDRVKRVEGLMHTYFGAEATTYHAAVSRCMLITGVARVFEPGCKADHVPILEAGQGKYKSTSIEALTSPWFSDEIADLGSKDASMQVRAAWCIEIAELSAMARPEVERVKAFISRRTDRFRPSYGRRVIEVPRQSFFVGTTNAEAYLKDDTGGRRYWPVTCGTIDVDAIYRDRNQLWAEATAMYRGKVKWWLNADEATLAREEQEDRYVEDPWMHSIENYVHGRDSVTSDDILQYGIEKPKERWSSLDYSRVCSCMRRLGFKKSRPWGREQSVSATGCGALDRAVHLDQSTPMDCASR
jgi:predicted P-loop ATPase